MVRKKWLRVVPRRAAAKGWSKGIRTQSSVEETRDGRRQCGAPLRQQFRCEIEVAAMNVAPAPGLAALEGRNQRMTGRVEMLKRVRVRRILAASDMATRSE